MEKLMIILAGMGGFIVVVNTIIRIYQNVSAAIKSMKYYKNQSRKLRSLRYVKYGREA